MISIALLLLNIEPGEMVIERPNNHPFSLLLMTIVVVVSGLFLGFSSSFFELALTSRRFGRLGHGMAVILKSLMYIILLVLVGVFSFYLYDVSYEGSDLSAWSYLTSDKFLPPFLYLFFTSFLVNGIIQVERILGRGNWFRFITGKYLSPVEEHRIFMFLDLNGSTKLAEDLGHLRMSAFLQDCFLELSELIMPYKGFLHQYVGDEAVLTWPLKQNRQHNAQCILLFFAFQRRLQQQSNHFFDKYGHVPEFKCGIHSGNVVISEVGKYKVELAYHGDAINTAARIMNQCRHYQKNILVSEQYLEHIDLPQGILSEMVGETTLPGKGTQTKLYHVFAP